MRRLTVLFAIVIVSSLVSMSQAGLFGWRSHWRRAQHPFYSNAQVDSIQYVKRNLPTGPADESPIASAVRTLSSPTRISHATTPQFGTLDEQRAAELGPEWARMVYPVYNDSEPYPACKAWKWDSDDGWGWDWSELNCPWRQSHTPPAFSD